MMTSDDINDLVNSSQMGFLQHDMQAQAFPMGGHVPYADEFAAGATSGVANFGASLAGFGIYAGASAVGVDPFALGMRGLGIGARAGSEMGGHFGAALAGRIGAGFGRGIGGAFGAAAGIGLPFMATSLALDSAVNFTTGNIVQGAHDIMSTQSFVREMGSISGGFGSQSILGGGFNSGQGSNTAMEMMPQLRQMSHEFGLGGVDDTIGAASSMAQSGMLGSVDNPQQLLTAFRNKLNQAKQVADAIDSSLAESVALLQQLQQSGVGDQAQGGLAIRAGTISSLTGQSMDSVVQSGQAGAQLGLRFGLSPEAGFSMGMNNLSSATVMSRLGIFDRDTVQMLGGPQGMASALTEMMMQAPATYGGNRLIARMVNAQGDDIDPERMSDVIEGGRPSRRRIDPYALDELQEEFVGREREIVLGQIDRIQSRNPNNQRRANQQQFDFLRELGIEDPRMQEAYVQNLRMAPTMDLLESAQGIRNDFEQEQSMRHQAGDVITGFFNRLGTALEEGVGRGLQDFGAHMQQAFSRLGTQVDEFIGGSTTAGQLSAPGSIDVQDVRDYSQRIQGGQFGMAFSRTESIRAISRNEGGAFNHQEGRGIMGRIEGALFGSQDPNSLVGRLQAAGFNPEDMGFSTPIMRGFQENDDTIAVGTRGWRASPQEVYDAEARLAGVADATQLGDRDLNAVTSMTERLRRDSTFTSRIAGEEHDLEGAQMRVARMMFPEGELSQARLAAATGVIDAAFPEDWLSDRGRVRRENPRTVQELNASIVTTAMEGRIREALGGVGSTGSGATFAGRSIDGSSNLSETADEGAMARSPEGRRAFGTMAVSGVVERAVGYNPMARGMLEEALSNMDVRTDTGAAARLVRGIESGERNNLPTFNAEGFRALQHELTGMDLGINFDDHPEATRAFLREAGVSLTEFQDTSGRFQYAMAPSNTSRDPLVTFTGTLDEIRRNNGTIQQQADGLIMAGLDPSQSGWEATLTQMGLSQVEAEPLIAAVRHRAGDHPTNRAEVVGQIRAEINQGSASGGLTTSQSNQAILNAETRSSDIDLGNAVSATSIEAANAQRFMQQSTSTVNRLSQLVLNQIEDPGVQAIIAQGRRDRLSEGDILQSITSSPARRDAAGNLDASTLEIIDTFRRGAQGNLTGSQISPEVRAAMVQEHVQRDLASGLTQGQAIARSKEYSAALTNSAESRTLDEVTYSMFSSLVDREGGGGADVAAAIPGGEGAARALRAMESGDTDALLTGSLSPFVQALAAERGVSGEAGIREFASGLTSRSRNQEMTQAARQLVGRVGVAESLSESSMEAVERRTYREESMSALREIRTNLSDIWKRASGEGGSYITVKNITETP